MEVCLEYLVEEPRALTGERRLLWAVLKVAMIDFIYPELHFASNPREVPENRRSSKSWFLNPRTLPYSPFSFPWVIEHLFPQSAAASLCDGI